MNSIPTTIKLHFNNEKIRYDWQCPVCDEKHKHYEDPYYTEEVMCYTCSNMFEVSND